ncbi:MAG TPA: hypothetical protein VMH02_00565, partial [Verrucomicrobiae bacterium]|nr:hypothetical protein [Verrucomicrobiae bacterium]
MALSRYARPGFAVVIGGLLLGLAACGGHSSAVLPSAQGEQPALSQPRSKPKIAIVPASLVFKGIGAAFARHVVVSETHYKGKFTEKSACAGVARAVPASGKGPSFKPKVTPLKDGKCAITFFDAKKHSAKLEIVVAASTPRPSPTPTRAPTSAPTNAPTPTPTPIPVSTPTPTPIPSVGALPASVDICPGSGGDACTPDSAVVTVSQSGFTGS